MFKVIGDALPTEKTWQNRALPALRIKKTAPPLAAIARTNGLIRYKPSGATERRIDRLRPIQICNLYRYIIPSGLISSSIPGVLPVQSMLTASATCHWTAPSVQYLFVLLPQDVHPPSLEAKLEWTPNVSLAGNYRATFEVGDVVLESVTVDNQEYPLNGNPGYTVDEDGLATILSGENRFFSTSSVVRASGTLSLALDAPYAAAAFIRLPTGGTIDAIDWIGKSFQPADFPANPKLFQFSWNTFSGMAIVLSTPYTLFPDILPPPFEIKPFNPYIGEGSPLINYDIGAVEGADIESIRTAVHLDGFKEGAFQDAIRIAAHDSGAVEGADQRAGSAAIHDSGATEGAEQFATSAKLASHDTGAIEGAGLDAGSAEFHSAGAIEGAIEAIIRVLLHGEGAEEAGLFTLPRIVTHESGAVEGVILTAGSAAQHFAGAIEGTDQNAVRTSLHVDGSEDGAEAGAIRGVQIDSGAIEGAFTYADSAAFFIAGAIEGADSDIVRVALHNSGEAFGSDADAIRLSAHDDGVIEGADLYVSYPDLESDGGWEWLAYLAENSNPSTLAAIAAVNKGNVDWGKRIAMARYFNLHP